MFSVHTAIPERVTTYILKMFFKLRDLQKAHSILDMPFAIAYMLPLMGAMWLCEILDTLFGLRELKLKDTLVGIFKTTLCALGGMIVFMNTNSRV
eukprot:COSAG02_NODE_22603_length_747_cov_0.594136_1_plen_95_part_00